MLELQKKYSLKRKQLNHQFEIIIYPAAKKAPTNKAGTLFGQPAQPTLFV